MNLTDLRDKIDCIDQEILSLFIKRMELCKNVAEYKKQNNLPVLQSGREQEIIDNIKTISPIELADGASVLFTNIMDISKSLQQKILTDLFDEPKNFLPNDALKIGCQGVSGAYQEAACKKLFPSRMINFYQTYTDVFEAVESGEIDFGILPIQNSTAGSVAETYDLMRKYDFYISSRIQVKINHCLAARKGTELIQIQKVYSHIQALSQCSEFLYKNSISKVEYSNTAQAAKMVSESDEPIGAICSEECAKQYGLEIICSEIADVNPNYTRFICISKDFYIPENPTVISVALSIPNVKGSLYRLLTKFSVNDLNLQHIESKPAADGSFDTIFYIDFFGNIKSHNTCALLNELENELTYFKFLGNYTDIL